MSSSPSDIDGLSLSERLQLVQDLWDSIAEDSESIPVTESQRKILERRLRSYREEGEPGRSWSEVREDLRSGE
jgi:putative addiction module component (TIGR02574 family)